MLATGDSALSRDADDDVDVTLIRWMLSLSPEERLAVLQGFADSMIRPFDVLGKIRIGRSYQDLIADSIQRTLGEIIVCVLGLEALIAQRPASTSPCFRSFGTRLKNRQVGSSTRNSSRGERIRTSKLVIRAASNFHGFA